MLIYKEGGLSAQTSIGELLNALAPQPIRPTATLGIQSLTRSLQPTMFQNPGGVAPECDGQTDTGRPHRKSCI